MTVIVRVPIMPPLAAVMTDVPPATPVTRPVAETVAVAAVADVQVAVAERSFFDPSLYIPVAVSWTVVAIAIEDVVDVTAIEASVGAVAVTVRPRCRRPSRSSPR